MKIGIYGGSFNPPHNTHIKIATELLNENIVDFLYVLPTSDVYAKNDLISVNHRVNMLNLCLKSSKIKVFKPNSDIFNYTYKALDYFKSLHPNDEICFVMGSDNLKEFSTWKNTEYILKNYSLIVILRDDDKEEDLLKLYNYKNIYFLKNKGNISSSGIRTEIKNGIYNKSILSSDVIDYIKQNNLYVGE